MSTHRKSLIKEVIDRLDARMALDQSRGQAKEVARAAHQKTWAFTTGKIHSYKTREVYQEHTMNFAHWARDTYGIKRIEDLDERIHDLTAEFLQSKLDAGKSAYTLQVTRAALRMVFGDRTLMQEVQIPKRTRSTITRSRGPKTHDRHFNPENWPKLITFLKATGLRRDELKMLQAKDIIKNKADPGSPHNGKVLIQVWNGKGGKSRDVPVLAGYEQDVLFVKKGLAENALVFPRIPKHLNVHSYRREYAQALYLSYVSNRTLPPADGRLRRQDYDRNAAEKATWALGHNRIDVILRHYLR